MYWSLTDSRQVGAILECLKQYLGETLKTAEKRFVGHLNTIVQQCHVNTKTPVEQQSLRCEFHPI
jgi:hypothetical protein